MTEQDAPEIGPDEVLPPFPNKRQVAAYYGTSVKQVEVMMRQGKLPVYRFGGNPHAYPRFRREDVEALLVRDRRYDRD